VDGSWLRIPRICWARPPDPSEMTTPEALGQQFHRNGWCMIPPNTQWQALVLVFPEWHKQHNINYPVGNSPVHFLESRLSDLRSCGSFKWKTFACYFTFFWWIFRICIIHNPSWPYNHYIFVLNWNVAEIQQLRERTSCQLKLWQELHENGVLCHRLLLLSLLMPAVSTL